MAYDSLFFIWIITCPKGFFKSLSRKMLTISYGMQSIIGSLSIFPTGVGWAAGEPSRAYPRFRRRYEWFSEIHLSELWCLQTHCLLFSRNKIRRLSRAPYCNRDGIQRRIGSFDAEGRATQLWPGRYDDPHCGKLHVHWHIWDHCTWCTNGCCPAAYLDLAGFLHCRMVQNFGDLMILKILRIS